MAERRVVANQVWKRYCRTMRRSVRYALTDSLRSFAGLPPPTGALRDDEFWSLRDVSFSLDRGEALAVVGTNGAGKSTLLKILSGVIAPDRGELQVRGRIVSLMMAGVGFHPMLTGRENALIYGTLLGMRRRDVERRMPAILDFADLAEFLDTPVKYYSTGMYMRLGFAVAVQCEPDVFVVDEVLAVGDAAFRQKCMDQLQAMKRNGTALLLVSHSAGHLRALADRGLWLQRGECMASGSIESVLDLYLGELEGAASPTLPDPTIPPTIVSAAAVVATAAPGDVVGHRGEIERVLPAGDEPLVLHAHTRNAVSLRLRGPDAGLEPELVVAIATPDDVTLAAASLSLGAATFPRLQAEHPLRVDLDLCPHTTTVDGRLVVRLMKSGADGISQTLVERSWPCRVEGRSADAPGADLQAVLHWREHSAESRPIVVDPGEEVTLVAPRREGARGWSLVDARGRPVAQQQLPPAPANADACVATLRAFLPAGTYAAAFDTGSERAAGPSFVVRDLAEPVGHADLDARCTIVPVPDHTTPATPTGTATIRCVTATLAGSAPELAALYGSDIRFDGEPRAAAAVTAVLASGERCRLRLRFHTTIALHTLDVAVGFGHPERGRCGGLRIRRDDVTAHAFDVYIEFAAHLARGDYLLGCSAVGRDAAGQTIEAHVADFARCFVLGPDETGSDGRLTIVGLTEEPRPTLAAPELRSEARDLGGDGLRLLGFGLDGHSGSDPAILVSGVPARVTIEALAVTAVARPSFKFAFVTPSSRCVARMTSFEHRHPMTPLCAGDARTYRMEFVPHLAGGRYQVQVALMQRRGDTAVVTDRRHQGAVCIVPARLRPLGPALLEASARIDAE